MAQRTNHSRERDVGGDLAERLVDSIEDQTVAIREQTKAVDNLAGGLDDLLDVGKEIAGKANVGKIIGGLFKKTK